MIKLKSLYTSHPVVILICGLCLAQIIGTIQVYLSNLALYNTLSNINSAGYLAVPNRLVMSGLRNLCPITCYTAPGLKGIPEWCL